MLENCKILSSLSHRTQDRYRTEVLWTMLNSSLNDLNYDTSFATGNLSTLDDHDRSINIQQQLHWAAAVLQLIQLYYTPVLVILGSIGNIISVFVFFNTKLRKQSSSYYLAALAISDTGFLITQFISWLNLVDLPLFKKSGYCQMTIYTSHVSKNIFSKLRLYVDR